MSSRLLTSQVPNREKSPRYSRHARVHRPWTGNAQDLDLSPCEAISIADLTYPGDLPTSPDGRSQPRQRFSRTCKKDPHKAAG